MTITACFKTDDGKVFDSFDAAQLHECLSHQTNVYLEEWKERQLLSIITDHFYLEAKPLPADTPSTESPENE